ncbi:DNA polymerase III, gamma and tau subunits [Plesiocystis pacifica SIR-1]|uniref:DNA polymerase III subunit gamma/tau n=1 Tax=Plesiocystis pacifica SIR-1 TaxID=391625 RepID=A6GJ36_9BACT|nr:DNA polymerase III subunit gamma/tau [Plesiocystis pacifica]EDM74111.1 DNA polymerase III, gamma and tau subunits [Plesiocystis pacifica SIR-1]
MAYLALARKYRPQRFADMIGQEHVTRTLENAIKSDRVHHAYLFCGVRGLGKTTAARILAKCLVCEHGPTPEPCNQCVHCVGINEGRSVDVIEIDGASNNSVDDIRSLRDQVHYLPQIARRKIYIIDEVHMLTQAAFNALLKTLEEPPPHVTFLFATTDPHKVLPTILSRVSRLDYRRVRAATLVPYLQFILEQEGFAVEPEGLYVIARCGDGSVRDSLTLLDKVIAFAHDPKAITGEEVLTVLGQASRYAVAELVQAILDRDAASVLQRFEQITSSGSDLMQLAVAILQHLRDLTVLSLTKSRAALLDMNDDLFEQLQRQAGATSPTVVAQHFDRFARVVDSIEHSRVPRLVIEMGLLELVSAEPLMPLGDLVTRLDALSKGRPTPRGGGGGGGGGRRGSGGGGGGRPRGPAPRQAAPAQAAPMRAGPPASAAPMPAPTPAPNPSPVVHRPPAQTQAPKRATAPAGGGGSGNASADMLERMAREAGLLGGKPEPAQARTPQRNAAPQRSAAAQRSAPPQSNAAPQRNAPPQYQDGPPPRDEPPWPVPAANDPRSPQGQGFALTNDRLRPVEPSSEVAKDPQAACPSSRCTPREPIQWRQLGSWDAWETFLSRVRQENDLLSAVLDNLGLLSLTEGHVELAAPANGFARTQLRENPEIEAAFEALAAAYFGENMHLELVDIVPSLPDAPSMLLVYKERQRKHREQIEHDAHSHPRIRALLHAFGGEVEKVDILAPPELPPLGERGLPS